MNCGKRRPFCRSRAWISVLLLGICPPALAQCNSNPIAVDDMAIYDGGSVLVVDVLANDVEPDGEALAVDMLSTTCPGTLSEDFGLVTWTGTNITSDCTISYRITDEDQNTDVGIVQVSIPADATIIFIDGFEAGDVSGWSTFQGRPAK